MNGHYVQHKRKHHLRWKSASFSVISLPICKGNNQLRIVACLLTLHMVAYSSSGTTSAASPAQRAWKRLCKKNAAQVPHFPWSHIRGMVSLWQKGLGNPHTALCTDRDFLCILGQVTEFLRTTLSGEKMQNYHILHTQTLLFKISPQIFHTFRCRELLMKWTQSYGGWEDGFKVLQNGKEFSNGNNFKIIDVENMVVLAHLVPTAPAQDRQQLLLPPLPTAGALFLVQDCMC